MFSIQTKVQILLHRNPIRHATSFCRYIKSYMRGTQSPLWMPFWISLFLGHNDKLCGPPPQPSRRYQLPLNPNSLPKVYFQFSRYIAFSLKRNAEVHAEQRFLNMWELLRFNEHVMGIAVHSIMVLCNRKGTLYGLRNNGQIGTFVTVLRVYVSNRINLSLNGLYLPPVTCSWRLLMN